MGWICLFLAAFLIDAHAGLRAFDGYFHPGYYGAVPVWMELRIPDGDGPVTGTYFYKKKGLPLQLEGARNGDTLKLSEWERKGRVTGFFTLALHPDSMNGTWQRPNPKKTENPSRVVFYRAAPEDRKYAVFPKPSELRLLNGKTLAQEMKENAEEAAGEEGGKAPLPTIAFLSYRRNIASISIGGEYAGGAYPQTWESRYNIDLETRKEFDAAKEIDPAQSKAYAEMLHDRFRVELAASRKLLSDSEWTDAFGTKLEELEDPPDDPLSVCFDLDTYNQCASGGSESYPEFTSAGLHEVIGSLYGFPHVIQALDLYLDVTVTWKELGKYLKKDSRLQSLVRSAR